MVKESGIESGGGFAIGWITAGPRIVPADYFAIDFDRSLKLDIVFIEPLYFLRHRPQYASQPMVRSQPLQRILNLRKWNVSFLHWFPPVR